MKYAKLFSLLLVSILFIGVVADFGFAVRSDNDNSGSSSDGDREVDVRSASAISVDGIEDRMKVRVRDKGGEERDIEVEEERKMEDGKSVLRKRLRVQSANGVVEVESELEVEFEDEAGETKMKIKSNNGRWFDVKVMPSTASERALEALKMRACVPGECEIVLRDKNVDSSKDDEVNYEVKARRKARIFGIFPTEVDASVEVDAVTGELKLNKPWWAFIVEDSVEDSSVGAVQ